MTNSQTEGKFEYYRATFVLGGTEMYEGLGRIKRAAIQAAKKVCKKHGEKAVPEAEMEIIKLFGRPRSLL